MLISAAVVQDVVILIFRGKRRHNYRIINLKQKLIDKQHRVIIITVNNPSAYPSSGMAELFLKQGKEYSSARPTYPKELFHFIASKTPCHDLAWDVGTGTGQAAKSLAEKFKNVIATDTSPKQLEFAPRLPNVRYQCTPPKMSISEVEQKIAPSSSVDLVTVAQAMHWFDLPSFYEQVKRVLKKPDGVIAAWCYKLPEINQGIDSVMHKFFSVDADPYLEPAAKLIDQKYETIDFPFQPVDGLDHTGPLEFKSTRMMNLESYFTYIRSWSAYQTAQRKGVELLSDEMVKDFTRAWNEDGKKNDENTVTFPIYLRIGKVGTLD